MRGPVRRALAAVALLTAAVTGCGSAGSAGRGHPVAGTPACAQLLARLQHVTLAISSNSELIANSVDKRQLSQRIAAEAVRLRQSADLMGEGPVPAPVAAADRQLVTALRAFGDDFARATSPAQRGDFQAAVDAMGDKPAIRKIVGASKTIQDACTQRTPA